MFNDDLGNRMKEFYENRSQTYLIRKIPVIIRLDGKSFHTLCKCKHFKKPYDNFFNESMAIVMKYLCRKVQGTVFAERHSDEVSLLVLDTNSIKTEAFFDYNVQKICSITASLASTMFSGILQKYRYLTDDEDYPIFDSRCFNIPEHEITNYFWWRLLDAVRNSIQSVAQSKFSHKQLHGKDIKQMQEMLFQDHGINWSHLPQVEKSGMICTKNHVDKHLIRCKGCGKVSPKEISTLDHRDNCTPDIEEFTIEHSIWEKKPAPTTRTELNDIILNLKMKYCI